MEASRINRGRKRVLEVGRGPLKQGMYLPPNSEHAAFPPGEDDGAEDVQEPTLDPPDGPTAMFAND